jgi:hypothetical protein
MYERLPRIGATRSIAGIASITVVVAVAVTAVVLARRIVASAPSGTGRTTTRRTARCAIPVAVAVGTIEAPRGRWGGTGPLELLSAEGPRVQACDTYLYFQDVVAADALVVHLMICVISIAAVLILNKRKPNMPASAHHPHAKPLSGSIQSAAS